MNQKAFGVATLVLLIAAGAVGAYAGTSHGNDNASVLRTVEPEMFASTTTAAAAPSPPVDGSSSDGASSSPGPNDLLAAIQQHLDADIVLSARLGAPPATDNWPGYWLYTTLAIPSATDGAAIPAVWEADLLQGDVAEQLNAGQRDLANVVSGGDAQGMLPDGSTVDIGGGAADVAAGQVFPTPNGGSSAIDANDERILADFGLTVDSIHILHPLDFAVSVDATISDPSAFSGKLAALLKALEGDPIDIEGLCVQLRGPDGSVWIRQAVAFRNGAGHLWVNPAASISFGTAHG